MRALRRWCQKHRLWIYLGAVMLPVLLSLGLQYRSLTALEFFSAAGHRLTLSMYLEAVGAEVAAFYRTQAERALHVAGSPLANGHPALVQPTFRQAQGVRLFFVSLMPLDTSPSLHFYWPTGEVTTSRPDDATVHAVRVALAPWLYLSRQQTVLEATTLSVNERDPLHRMILKPLTDDASRVAGVIGMLVDPAYLQHHYLPQVMQDLLPQFCDENARKNAIVAAHDADGSLLMSSHPIPDTEPEVTVPIPFLFTDWRLGVWNRYVTPEQWARLHFWINVGLSIFLALVLIAGVLLALRMAVRSMRLAQMQTDFVSNVSHELRTPLASIRASGELLRLGRVETGEKVCEYGGYIETESLRLTRLIDNILDFAKMESQQKTYDAAPVDIEAVVTETLGILAVRLKQGGYQVDVEWPSSPLPPVMGDAAALTQALLNIVDNAMKYAGDARLIQIRLGHQSGANTIAVTDDGIGIPREEQTRVFERFYRVSTGLVHNVKGTGLGLAIVRHIIAAHDGHVALESVSGQGTTIIIHLPVADVIPEPDQVAQVDGAVHEQGVV